MSELNQPHDRFFSQTFARMDIVEDILFSNIPELSRIIQPGSLQQAGEKLVNPELGRFYSDLLLKGQLDNGKSAYIYLLIEHKSFHEPDVSFDLIGYMVEIWRKIREKSKPLPFLFPIVLYHGKSTWSLDPYFSSMVETPEGMEDYTPNFKFYLFDLSQYNDDDLKGAIVSRVVLLLFKHIFDEDFGERFISICKLLGELREEKSALEFMRSVLEYIGNAAEHISKDEVREGIREALPQKGEELMPTLFEQIRQEGRLEGRQEGRQEGRNSGLIEGLQKGIQLALELKYGQEGLAFYPQIKEIDSIDRLYEIEGVLRESVTLEELEHIITKNK